MARHVINLPDLVIALGAQASNALTGDLINTKVALGYLVDFVVFGPAGLAETVAVQVSHLEEPTSSDWFTVNIDGTDVTVGASKAVPVPVAAIRALRLFATPATAAERTFHARGQVATM